MNEEEIVQEIKNTFPEDMESLEVIKRRRITGKFKAGRLIDVAKFIKEEIKFEYIAMITATHYPPNMELLYVFFSYTHKCMLELRTVLPDSSPQIDSLCPLWMGAEFHERETYDYFGIIFTGNPNLTRVLNPDDTTIFPLRKEIKLSHTRRWDAKLQSGKESEKAVVKNG